MTIHKESLDFARTIFNELDIDWMGDEPHQGVNRKAWSWEETNAMNVVSKFAYDELGMSIYEDLAGNRHMVSTNHANRNTPARMTGSHLDAVKNGGRYDGPAGVIAPMAAMYQAKMNGDIPNQPSVITIWRNEESPWLNQFAVGSKLATGVLNAEFVKTAIHTAYDRTLYDLMDGLGLHPSRLIRKIESSDARLIDPNTIEGLVETHIEQSYTLERHEKSLGVVTTIRGNHRFPEMITFNGVSGHTGTVPQKDRKDAVLAMGLYIANIHARLTDMQTKGRDIVWSFPEGGSVDGKSSSLCAKAVLRPEVRSTDSDVLARAATHFEDAARIVSGQTGVHIEITKTSQQSPVGMSKSIADELMNHAQMNNIPSMTMPSGAGHDVQVLAEAGVHGGLIFIRHGNEGVSHRPDEIMALAHDDDPFAVRGDFANAVQLNHAWLMGNKHQHRSQIPISFVKDIQSRGAQLIL